MACRLIVISGMAFEARVAQGAGIRTIYGLNPEKLVADIENAIGEGANGLLSFGTAAGLFPSLRPGTIVVAHTVSGDSMRWKADAAWSARLLAQLPGAVCADIAGVRHPVASIEEKAILRGESGAVAADQESHHVAALAQRYHLPFAGLRIVLDDANSTVPPAALMAAHSDGSVHYARLIRSLLAHPRQLPALMQLAADYRAAKSMLWRCGDRLRGSLFGMDIR